MRPRSTDGEESSDEGDSYEAGQAQPRAQRHSSANTLPSQDLGMHYGKRIQHHIPHHPHLGVNGIARHHPQAVYLSPNPSSAGPQAPPMYYTSNGYPHTPNSMVHREGEEEYDNAAGTDGMTGEPNPYHRMQMQQPKYHAPQQYHSHNSAGSFHPGAAEHVAYYSPNLPTPAVSPASSCSGPNLPPPSQYSQTGNSGHHSPPSGHATANSQHQPTPYQAHPPSAQHPQPIHYAAAYSGHNRLYNMNGEVDSVPRMHAYSSSANMPMGAEGNHGMGMTMGQPMKVEVSTPMGAAW